MRKKNDHLKIGQTVVLLALLLVAILTLGGCGYSATDNETTGQVKKVVHATPVFCSNRYDVDISLGVMRGGVGSISKEDMWLTIDNRADYDALKKAADDGRIVRVHYDVWRFAFCTWDHHVTKVEIID